MTSRFQPSPFGRASVLALGLGCLLTLGTPARADQSLPPASPDKPAATDNKASGDAASADHSSLRPSTKDGKSADKKSSLKRSKRATAKAKKKRLPLIHNPKLDPKAEHVQLFDGIEGGVLSVKVVAENAFGGNVLIQNQSTKPLTVDLPDGFVAVPILRQFGGGAAAGRGGAGGGGQAMGGGMGGGMGGMGGGGMGGGGMGAFSIPAERIAEVPFHSVCLEHGKTEPDAAMRYKLVPVSEFTSDENLTALISLIASNSIDTPIAQAAAWHLSSKMSWDELAAKAATDLGTPDAPYFSPQALSRAQQLVADAKGLARERAQERAKRGDAKEKERSSDKPVRSQHVIEGR